MCRWFRRPRRGYRGAADRDGRQPPRTPSATSRGEGHSATVPVDELKPLPPPNLDLIERSGAFRAQAEAVRRTLE